MSGGNTCPVVRDDGAYYPTTKDAALDLMREWGIRPDVKAAYTMGSNIGKAARGQTKTAYDHKWRCA